MKKPKITFLMAAHNEEKVIGMALMGLVKTHKDYPNMEVLIGLDGCTDNTLKIVKKFSKRYRFIKFIEMNERKGKQAVLDKLEPYIKGDIIFIHDADWTFTYGSKKDLLDYLKIFDDPKIGGIVESIDSEMTRPDFEKIKSIGFLASAWGNHLLLSYIKTKFTNKKGNIRIYDPKKMKFCPFLDVYKKKVLDMTKHKEELRAGDHVERSLRILKAGYKLATFDNPQWPHFVENYNKQSIKDLIKQKIRGLVSKKKIQNVYGFKIPFFGFYVPFFFYILDNSLKVRRWRDFFAIQVYLFVMIYSFIIAFFKQKISNKEIWSLRIKR